MVLSLELTGHESDLAIHETGLSRKIHLKRIKRKKRPGWRWYRDRRVSRFDLLVWFWLNAWHTISDLSPWVSADDVTTALTGDMTVWRQVLNNSAKILQLNRRSRLKAMRRLHVEGDICSIQQVILGHFIVQEIKVTISEAGVIKLSRLANKLTGNFRRDSTFADVMKTILKFAISFEKEYNKRFVLSPTMDITKDMMYSDFPTGMRV